jgi:hypothetical protein
VKKLFMGKRPEEVAAMGAMRNPESLDEYESMSLIQLY